MESDEDLFVTQNSFISRESTHNDTLSTGEWNIDFRLDRLLCGSHIQERARQCVPVAKRYKDEWSVKAFETWRSNWEKIARHDESVRSFKTRYVYRRIKRVNATLSIRSKEAGRLRIPYKFSTWFSLWNSKVS